MCNSLSLVNNFLQQAVIIMLHFIILYCCCIYMKQYINILHWIAQTGGYCPLSGTTSDDQEMGEVYQANFDVSVEKLSLCTVYYSYICMEDLTVACVT